MIEEFKNIKSTKRDLRNFGLIIGSIFVVLGIYYFFRSKDNFFLFLIIGVLLLVFGTLFPFVLKPLQKVWMAIGIVLGWFVTNIILSIFFFIFVTTIAFFARLAGKTFLDNKFKVDVESYWKYRDGKKSNRQEIENQF